MYVPGVESAENCNGNDYGGDKTPESSNDSSRHIAHSIYIITKDEMNIYKGY